MRLIDADNIPLQVGERPVSVRFAGDDAPGNNFLSSSSSKQLFHAHALGFRFFRVRLVWCFILMATFAPVLHAELIMRIDVVQSLFYFEGSDTGNGASFDSGFGPASYDLQFIYYFLTQPTTSASITSTPQDLFTEGSTLPISSGNMNLIRSGSSYVFIDLSSNTDITTLTGAGPSAAISYGHLPASDQELFETMIGNSMSLSIGTGYSPISVQVVPEPTTTTLLLGGIAGLITWHRRRRSNLE